ncbi:unnamed protein product [Spirodela intermedia]|uniref:Uncharacterized protein n=1 Tax=Spirodela intermedia TaxID=51605 RepID=A0A7I8ILK8_SPIIN|nr:unnamed protein product [Spirodela intermedia]CAA6658844.1 unnamed protein product [Spirodela intermedia]
MVGEIISFLRTAAFVVALLLVSTAVPAAGAGASAAHVRPRKLFLVKQQPLVLKYHNGVLLKGNYTLNLVWYGRFSTAQRAILTDFLVSLSSTVVGGGGSDTPSVAAWWRTTEFYDGGATRFLLGAQSILEDYPRGKLLTGGDITALAAAAGGGRHQGSVAVVFTAGDVAVEGFCMSRCGSHGAAPLPSGKNRRARFAYIWIGNSEAQCPGQCAWPFHQPVYGPQTPPLVAPNGDVGVDGMVINLATLVAGTVTNPFAGGFFQGPAAAPLEARFLPGEPRQGVDGSATGGSYNAAGVGGRKFLLPAMWDPKTSQCYTLL